MRENKVLVNKTCFTVLTEWFLTELDVFVKSKYGKNL